MRIVHSLMLVLLLVTAAAADDTRGEVLLDGNPVEGGAYVVLDGEAWFPLAAIAKAAGAAVSVEADGRVLLNGKPVDGARRVEGLDLVSRAALKKLLSVTVFVDGAARRALLTSAKGRQRMVETARTAPPPPAVRPTPGAAPASPPGSKPPAQAAGPSLEIFGVEVDRHASTHLMQVRGRVRNASARDLKGVTLTLLFWEADAGTEVDAVTGQQVSSGTNGSYPITVGDVAAGQTAAFEVQTSIMNPEDMNARSQTLTLDTSTAFDAFRRRKLRFGFKGATP